MKKFILTLTEDQARALSFASEIVSRLYMGQLDSLKVFTRTHDNYEEINILLKQLRQAMKLIPVCDGVQHPNSYFGIMSREIPNRSRTLFDIHQIIRHQLWKGLSNGPSYIVDSSPAFQCDHSQPLPEMKDL